MRLKKRAVQNGIKVSLLALLLVVGCGSTFKYKWYNLDLKDYSVGKLLGEKEEDDLHISVCAPTSNSKLECVVVLREEFQRLREDTIRLNERLSDCERRRD